MKKSHFYATLLCVAVSIIFMINNATAQKWVTIIDEDFSTDPFENGWITNNPEDYYWHPDSQALFTDNYTNSGDWATTDIDYNGESFCLTFDVLPMREVEENGDVDIGLFGPTRYSNGDDTEERLFVMFGGYDQPGVGAIYIYGCNSGGEFIWSGPGTGLMLNGAWHHVEVTYDSETTVVTLKVTRDDIIVLYWHTAMNFGFSPDLLYLGVSMAGEWETSGRHEIAYIDNMNFSFHQGAVCRVPDDHPTIQECIDAASDGDMVLVSPGLYEECINFNGKNIVVASNYIFSLDELDIENTIIDGGGNGTVVTFENGEDNTAQIVGFTIQNGIANEHEPSGFDGGGIYCLGSSPTIRSNRIQNNTARDDGAGICCDGGSNAIVRDNHISGNHTEIGQGAGIVCTNDSDPQILLNVISGNSADGNGGGICCIDNSDPVISDNIITGNWTNDNGGGIHCYSSGPTISSNTISDNSAYKGGGIYCDSSEPTISQNTISSNVASWIGGGIWCINYSNVTVDNNTIINNSANYDAGIGAESYCEISIVGNLITQNLANFTGGAIRINMDSYATIVGNTIVDNTASYGNGGIAIGTGQVYISDNTISGNSSRDGGGIGCHGLDRASIITGNTISGNSAWLNGGGIICYDNVDAVISDNTITGNSTDGNGGGIYCGLDSNPLISDNDISANSSAGDGGGIYCSDSDSAIIRHNDIYENSANAGGAIHCSSSDNPKISENSLHDNSASDGGAICCTSSNPTIEYNVIASNHAVSAGGGISLPHETEASTHIYYNLIVSNDAANGGGIYLHNLATPDIKNNTIAYNTAYEQGGGILSDLNSNPTISNSIICQNLPSDIELKYGGTVTITYSDVCDLLWGGEGNISTDPLFRDAANGDFHLQDSIYCGYPDSSLCIDAGDPADIDIFRCCSWGLALERSDMGAYGGGEYGEIPPCIYIPGDCDHNGVPLEITDAVTMIGMYRGTVESQYSCDCPMYGDDFAPHADPNGNCIAYELNDVITEIDAYRGSGSASGCPDCPGY